MEIEDQLWRQHGASDKRFIFYFLKNCTSCFLDGFVFRIHVGEEKCFAIKIYFADLKYVIRTWGIRRYKDYILGESVLVKRSKVF